MEQRLRGGRQVRLLVGVGVIDGLIEILVNSLEDAFHFARDHGNVVDGRERRNPVAWERVLSGTR